MKLTSSRIRLFGQFAVVIALTCGTNAREVHASSMYTFPIVGTKTSSFSDSHAGYPATDIFANCGVSVVAPVSGSVNGLRHTDLRNRQTGNPWYRGGEFVSIIGSDGVRYYFAHLDSINDRLVIGSAVDVGQQIGTVGRTGRASACHLHFGISPPCAKPEWWVRRGVIWPAKYLRAWKAGVGKSMAEAGRRYWPQGECL